MILRYSCRRGKRSKIKTLKTEDYSPILKEAAKCEPARLKGALNVPRKKMKQ